MAMNAENIIIDVLEIAVSFYRKCLLVSGSVIENLSNRELFYILSCLIIAQFTFFLLGGLIAPEPSNSMEFLMVPCFDKNLGSSREWFYLRRQNGSNCKQINLGHSDKPYQLVTGDVREIVFVSQMPHARDGIQLEYSPWFQSLLGLLTVDIEYVEDERWKMGDQPELGLDVRMGYRDGCDDPKQWHKLIDTTISRQLDCSMNDEMVYFDTFKTTFTSSWILQLCPRELFELGSNDHSYYLLNLRIPGCNESGGKQNCDIGRLVDLHIVAIHQNGGFTKVWLSMKTFLTPFILFALVWYWKRVNQLARKLYLIEKAIFALGLTLEFLDFPVEWLSLWINMPYMLLVSDVRQGIFYVMLFSFWLIFTGEHLMEDWAKNNLIYYWKHLSIVLFASICLFTFDMFERGMHLKNPFYSIWATHFGRNIAYVFILLAAILSGIYFIFLCYKVARVLGSIKRKNSYLHNLNKNGQLRFEDIIYRFKFLMILTLICAALTVARFIMEQVGEGQLRWGDYDHSPALNTTSAFLTGTFGMWNVYVLLLLVMYAPSHEQYTHVEQENDGFDYMSKIDMVSILSEVTGKVWKQHGDPITLGTIGKSLAFVSDFGAHCLLRVYPSANVLTVDIQWLKTNENNDILNRTFSLQINDRICDKISAKPLRPVITIPRVSTVPRLYSGSCWETKVYEFDRILFDRQSVYQNVRILHHREFGNTLVLDEQINMSESDLIYTESLMHKDSVDYEEKQVLILGGGDGALLHEILKFKPEFVTMIEIDSVVIHACRQHLRNVCGSALDQLNGKHHQILIEDCFPVLSEFQSQNRQFDVVISDLTDIPLTSEEEITDECLMKKVLKYSWPIVKKNGYFITHLGGMGNPDPIERYEKTLKCWNLNFKRTTKMIPSFLEIWAFYKILKDENSRESLYGKL